MKDRELDALIAEKVMGQKVKDRPWSSEGPCLQNEPGGAWYILPRYSTNIAAAFQVVEKMRGRGYQFTLSSHRNGIWRVEIGQQGGEGCSESLPMAVCHACIVAISNPTGVKP